MTRVIRAELRRLLRRRPLAGIGAGVMLFALVAAISVFATAGDSAPGLQSRRGGAAVTDLAAAGGGTEAFAVGSSFAGFLVFVTVIAVVATEFSAGTFRTLALRQPGRLRLMAGKLAGLWLVVAGVTAAAAAVTFAVSWLVAPSQDISTVAWFTDESLAAAGRDYVTALAGFTGWLVFGATLAVVFRSAPLALAVGFAWAGPFENIVAQSWSTGYRWFPGQVLASLIRGGTVELGFGRAALTAAAYVAIAATALLTLISRKDVTA